MTMPALITTFVIEGVLALSARDRFQAMRQHSSSNVMTSKWFTVLMVVLLAGAVVALVAVSIYKKAKELKERQSRANETKPVNRAPSRAAAAVTATYVTDTKTKNPARPAGGAIGMSNVSHEGRGAMDEGRVAGVAKQVASLISAANLNDEEIARLAELILKQSAQTAGVAEGVQ